MSLIVTITGSPSAESRTARVSQRVASTLISQGFEVQEINVRTLPPADLLHAKQDAEALAEPLALIERARGLVVSTPVYKAAYSGILKAFLDLLPQFALRGKVVLPLMTGGTPAHVLAIDYALRPVLLSLGAQHVVAGLFLLDKAITARQDGGVDLEPELATRLDGVVADFTDSLRRRVDAR
jgi:FMN reductase